MNNKKLYYIISLVFFIIGIVVIGVHVNSYRQAEYYANASNMIGQTGSDQSLKITGRLSAGNNDNLLGRSRIPDSAGNIVLQPTTVTNNIKLQGNTSVAGEFTVNDKICIQQGSNKNCFTSFDKDDWNLIKAGNSQMCLDAPRSDNGAHLHMWSCHKGDNQKWKYLPSTQQIVSMASNKCVDVTSGDRKRVGIMQCDPNSINQKFFYNPETSAYHWVRDPTHRLDRPNNANTRGTRLQFHPCNKSVAQQWSVTTS